MTSPKRQRTEEPTNQTRAFLHLPRDLIDDVLCRLSAKTLMICKSVSKQLRSLIEDQDFIDYHLKRSVKKNTNSVILQSERGLRCARLDFPVGEKPIPEGLSWIERYGFESNYWAKCSCNGLVIFVADSKNDIIISNVSTGEYVLILSPYHVIPTPCNLYFTSYGFGYDSVSDDYKLVLVDRVISEFRHGSCVFVHRTCVYSMKRNEWVWSWNFSDLIPNPALSGVFLKGFVHWVSLKEEIVAFDLDTEEFRLVPLPNGGKFEASSYERMVTVHVLRGCLLMTIPRRCEIEMWVMKDYMVKESWTKLYTISDPMMRFICPINSDEFLIQTPSKMSIICPMNGDLFLTRYCYRYINLLRYKYNSVAREEILVGGNMVNAPFDEIGAVVFVESLVQIRKLLGARGRPRVREGNNKLVI